MFAVVRLCTDRKIWQPAIGLIVVGVSSMLAGKSGQTVDFYLTAVLMQAGGGVVFLVSILVRWPVIGLVMSKYAVTRPAIVGITCARRYSWRSS